MMKCPCLFDGFRSYLAIQETRGEFAEMCVCQIDFLYFFTLLHTTVHMHKGVVMLLLKCQVLHQLSIIRYVFIVFEYQEQDC